jgi:Histidine kinase-, DNA gyrase B-, and HSP90-like ATPase
MSRTRRRPATRSIRKVRGTERPQGRSGVWRPRSARRHYRRGHAGSPGIRGRALWMFERALRELAESTSPTSRSTSRASTHGRHCSCSPTLSAEGTSGRALAAARGRAARRRRGERRPQPGADDGRPRLQRVTTNLILNALRYGRPPVEVSSVSSKEYRLVVEDRGDGAAPEFVPRLFERFSRGNDARRQGAARRRARACDRLGLRQGGRGRAALQAGEPARRPLHLHAAGSSNVKREPWRSLDSTQIVPFIRRTSSRQI